MHVVDLIDGDIERTAFEFAGFHTGGVSQVDYHLAFRGHRNGIDTLLDHRVLQWWGDRGHGVGLLR